MQDHPSPGVTADTCADRRIEQWIVNSGLPAHSDLPSVEELAQRVGFVPNEVCRALPMLLRAGSLTRTADGRIRGFLNGCETRDQKVDLEPEQVVSVGVGGGVRRSRR